MRCEELLDQWLRPGPDVVHAASLAAVNPR
jgi:hypothetical protein